MGQDNGLVKRAGVFGGLAAGAAAVIAGVTTLRPGGAPPAPEEPATEILDESAALAAPDLTVAPPEPMLDEAPPQDRTESAGPDIIVSEQGGRRYFHLRYLLTPENTLIGDELAQLRGGRLTGVSDGGQFEVLTPVDDFPVQAPNCQDHIIIRMPWTDSASAGAAGAIEAKRILFEEILAMDADGGAVEVSLELNPYVEVVSEEPLTLHLTQCNVFFRHAAGRYIESVGEVAARD